MILIASDTAIAQAAQALRDGQLVGLPTETVYGLAANATDDAAVAKIFLAKGRPADHPLIVHVAGVEQVPLFASQVPEFAQKLMQAFWPGPLTLILPRLSGVATASAGGQDSIGLRCPSHPVAQAILQEGLALGVLGVSAPSANRFGRVSPTTAAHVQSELGPELLILDGGECAVGIESTIVDCTRGEPVLLRPGQITPPAPRGRSNRTMRRAPKCGSCPAMTLPISCKLWGRMPTTWVSGQPSGLMTVLASCGACKPLRPSRLRTICSAFCAIWTRVV
jgi:L-threonylcarbamoyladenylate synthase